MSQGDKTPLEEFSPRQEKLTELSAASVCVFRAATSDPTASPKHHPDPRALGGSGSRSLRRTGCLELTASAVGSDGRPLPARTPRASGAGGKPNPRSAERPDHSNRTGPAPPAQPCPPPAPRPRGGGGRPPAAEAQTFTPTFCFASGLALALAPPWTRTQTLIFHRPRTVPPSPRGPTSFSEN